MDKLLDLILNGLQVVYDRPWIAFCALLVMMIWAGVLVVLTDWKIRPYLRAVRGRLAALTAALGGSTDPVLQRQAFADKYLEVSEVLDSDGAEAEGLVQAWREFRETIIDESPVVRSTTRPGPYFHRAAPRLTNLIFASNAFVAAGLILTFVGLVVALHTAAGNMGDVEKAKSALTELLTIASAKFLTSIGGIGASLWLRFAEHRLRRKVVGDTEKICTLLEAGTLYVPQQRLAAEQLEVLREQAAQLKVFNTDFAIQVSERIGGQFQQAIAPVTASLSTLNDNMTSMSQGLGQGAAKAIEEASGGELRALGQTLATLGERLDSLSATVNSSGDAAAEQIRAAGADFARAAADIREAFNQLAAQVDGMGRKLAEQGEATLKAQDEALGRVLTGLEQAQGRSAEVMADAVTALRSAGAEAAQTMQRDVSAALATGVAESQRTFRTALDEAGEGLRGAAGNLVAAVGSAAGQIERAGSGFERSGESASRTAEAMTRISEQATAAANALGESSNRFTSAATPVTQAVQAVSETASRMARSLEIGRTAEAEAVRGLKELADSIRQTHSSAETAWRDYRVRFEGVDKALEKATEQLSETLGMSIEELRKFAASFDSQMATAVSRFGETIDLIEEYAGSLDDYVETVRPARVEAAE